MKTRAPSRGARLLLAAGTLLVLGTTAAAAERQAGSPATTYKLVSSFGSTGTGDGQFAGATGIGIDGQGVVYVADSNNYRVEKFDADGRFLGKWGTRGVGQGQFTIPHDVAIDTAGSVWVADFGTYRLQRFTTSGGIPKDGKTAVITGLDSQPDTVAVDADGNLFVTEFFANKVYRYDAASNWGLGATWGGTGTASGQFNRPRGIATSPDGSVYVDDRDNYRAQRFDTNGKFLNGWGKNGVGPGMFRQPVGAAVDRDCNVWIADRDADRLQKFTPAGKLLAQIPNTNTSLDVAIGPTGDIYVLESLGTDQSVKRFREVPGPRPANAPAKLDLRYDRKAKRFLVSVAYTVDNVGCPSSLGATAVLKTATGKTPGSKAGQTLGTKAGLRLPVGHPTTIDIPVAKAAILGAHFSTAGSFKEAKTQLSVVLKTNGRDTPTVKNGALRVSIVAIKSGALPGLKALVKR